MSVPAGSPAPPDFAVTVFVRAVGSVEEHFGDLPAAIRFAQERMREAGEGKRMNIEISVTEDTGSPKRLIALETGERWPYTPLLAPPRPASGKIPGGPVIGFRCWRMKSECTLTGGVIRLGQDDVPDVQIDSTNLTSRYMNSVWRSPQVRFQCEAHKVPDQSHGCGLYAYNRYKLAVGENHHRDPLEYRDPSDVTVLGVVSGHGDVMVHKQGFRAEEMHILGLVDSGPYPQVRRKLSQKLDVPLVHEGEVERFARSRGRIISKFDVDPRRLPRLLRQIKRVLD